jgi:hypothetical protein
MNWAGYLLAAALMAVFGLLAGIVHVVAHWTPDLITIAMCGLLGVIGRIAWEVI